MNLLYLIVAIYLILGVYARIGPYSPQEVLNLSPEEVKAWLQQPECILLGLGDAQTFEEYQTRLADLKSQWDYNNFQEGTELHKIAVKIIVKLKLFPKESSEFGNDYQPIAFVIERQCSPSLIDDILQLPEVLLDNSNIESLIQVVFQQDNSQILNVISNACPQVDLTDKSLLSRGAYENCAYNCVSSVWPQLKYVTSDDPKRILMSVSHQLVASSAEKQKKCLALMRFAAQKVSIREGQMLTDMVYYRDFTSSKYIVRFAKIANYKNVVDDILARSEYGYSIEYPTAQKIELLKQIIIRTKDDKLHTFILLKVYKMESGRQMATALLGSPSFMRKNQRLSKALFVVLNLRHTTKEQNQKQVQFFANAVTKPSRFQLFWAKSYLAWKSFTMGVKATKVIHTHIYSEFQGWYM
ncbi:hypothetical protein MP228_010875 [Amoeboaphelidium protococcarum]|nr:hypothetical protein MP228_010875 [Amoeboaphelidium protococcarum]